MPVKLDQHDSEIEGQDIDSRSWVMKAANKNGDSNEAIGTAIRSAWVGFIDLIKVGPVVPSLASSNQ